MEFTGLSPSGIVLQEKVYNTEYISQVWYQSMKSDSSILSSSLRKKDLWSEYTFEVGLDLQG